MMLSEEEQDYQEQIAASMADAQEKVRLGEALDRLRKNRDFQKIVAKGFVEAEAARAARYYGALSVGGQCTVKGEPVEGGTVLNIIRAVGAFEMYLQNIETNARSARRALSDMADDDGEDE